MKVIASTVETGSRVFLKLICYPRTSIQHYRCSKKILGLENAAVFADQEGNTVLGPEDFLCITTE